MCILLCWWWIVCLVDGNAEASFLELCKICLTEHEAVPSNTREKFIHQEKVFHGEGKIRVLEQPPMIAWHHDLWKQVLVLGTTGKDEVAPFESQSECWLGIC